jgi:stress response protein SCP2
MGIQLSKGERLNVSKAAPNLKQVAIGASSEVNLVGQSYDVDASVFMLGARGKIIDEKYLILR